VKDNSLKITYFYPKEEILFLYERSVNLKNTTKPINPNRTAFNTVKNSINNSEIVVGNVLLIHFYKTLTFK